MNEEIKVSEMAEATSYGADDMFMTVSSGSNKKMKIAKINNYSTSETIAGVWIDGSPLYRKVIDFGYLPDTNTKAVDTGLTDVTILSIQATAFSSSYSTTLTIPDTLGNAPMRILYNANNKVEINTQNDRSSFYSYVILEYIKNTN